VAAILLIRRVLGSESRKSYIQAVLPVSHRECRQTAEKQRELEYTFSLKCVTCDFAYIIDLDNSLIAQKNIHAIFITLYII
jgi:hypothetical protein